MAVFIDSGVFAAFHNTRDSNHARASQLIRETAAGNLGSAYTSDYVFDEAVTLALVRTRRPEIALDVGKMILGELTEPFLAILRVNDTAFRKAWELFSRYIERGLNFTDCTSIALMETRNIENMVSFDSDFDGILPRIS